MTFFVACFNVDTYWEMEAFKNHQGHWGQPYKDTIHVAPLHSDQFRKSSLSLCNCPPFIKKKIDWRSDLWLWSSVTAKEKCRIYSLLLQPDSRNNCCETWRWVSSYKPVLHINYLIRRSQWLYKLSHSFVFNGLCVHIKPQRPSYTSQERAKPLVFTELERNGWLFACSINCEMSI